MRKWNHLRISLKRSLLAAGFAVVSAPAWTAQLPDAVASDSSEQTAIGTLTVVSDDELSQESAAHAKWADLMARTPSSDEGCFHASYPSIVWERVPCKIGQPRVHPTHVQPSGDADVVGNGHDYVAKAQGLITFAFGHFSTKGVKSEQGVGGDGGILGSNEYSVQLNTNAKMTTSACAHHSGCTVWQQFVYSPDYYVPGEAAVYMQYWLINWGFCGVPRRLDSPWCRLLYQQRLCNSA